MEESDRTKILECLEELIKSTSDAQLAGILNLFKEEKHLNSWMINEIRTNENPQRRFYEMVPRRGPNIFNSLKLYLNQCGLTRLTNLLNGNASEFNIHQPTEDLLTDGNFLGRQSIRNNNKNEVNIINEKAEIYTIKSKPKGLVVIVNNYEFPYKQGHDRHGSEKDVERLEKYWKSSGYRIETKTNLNKLEFQWYIKDLSSDGKLKSIDSLIVFIMSHGKEVHNHPRLFLVECPDNGYIESEWILGQFDSIQCPCLGGKPKIIFFQTCRGQATNHAIAIDGPTPITNSIVQMRIVPLQSDLLVVYSTNPGCVSLRDPHGGSYFIQELCDVLELRTRQDLREVLDEVSLRLKERVRREFGTFFQVMHIENFGFDKRFLLDN